MKELNEEKKEVPISQVMAKKKEKTVEVVEAKHY